MTQYSGKRPELGWSQHMTGGWIGQAAQMRRWHARMSGATSPEDRYDFSYAFFECAFHLRDWFIDCGAAEKGDLEALFNAHEELRICRDLANAHKHYSIKWPSQPHPPSEVREYAPGAGNLRCDVSLTVLSNGQKYDLFQLADRVLAIWEDFIAAYEAERAGPYDD
jgi:hypothetical protein